MYRVLLRCDDVDPEPRTELPQQCLKRGNARANPLNLAVDASKDKMCLLVVGAN